MKPYMHHTRRRLDGNNEENNGWTHDEGWYDDDKYGNVCDHENEERRLSSYGMDDDFVTVYNGTAYHCRRGHLHRVNYDYSTAQAQQPTYTTATALGQIFVALVSSALLIMVIRVMRKYWNIRQQARSEGEYHSVRDDKKKSSKRSDKSKSKKGEDSVVEENAAATALV